MIKWFESLLDPTGVAPNEPPTEGLVAFYWHFARQVRWIIVALFATGLVVALLDITVPIFIGRVVTLVSGHHPDRLFAEAGWQVAGMALILLVGRPVAHLAQNLVTNQIINPGVTNLIRWQTHWHVVRQSWTFFQNDFAGRIANRVIQTGPALRESIVSGTNAIWYILVYGTSAIALLGAAGWRLAVPIVCWFACYAVLLKVFVPRMRERSRAVSEARSTLTGRIVDSYTNILTVKLFARAHDEDAFARDAVDHHTAAFRRQTRMATGFTFTLAVMNAALVVGTGAAAILLFRGGHIALGAVATALPMAWQITSMAGWVAQNVAGIFENVGIGAGRHALDRRAAANAGPAGRARPCRYRRRNPLRESAFRLRPRSPNRRVARHRPHHRAGRARRPGRRIGRRQVDARQPAAALSTTRPRAAS